jgi:hypothetical protein
MKIIQIIGLIMVVLSIFSLVLIPIFGLSKNPAKIVKCYDKFGNEIIGQQCFEDYSENINQTGISSIIIIMILFIVGSILMGLGEFP